MARMIVSKFPDSLVFKTKRDMEKIFYQNAKYGEWHYFEGSGFILDIALPDAVNAVILKMFVGDYIVGAQAGAEAYAAIEPDDVEISEILESAWPWFQAGRYIHRAVELGIVVPVRGGVNGLPAWRLVSREPRWIAGEARSHDPMDESPFWTSVQVRGLPPAEQRRQHLREARAARRLRKLAQPA